MKSIDIKSLLIGILGTALVMVLMGVKHDIRRYQLACKHDNRGGDCYVMDVRTAKTKILRTSNSKNRPMIMLYNSNWMDN